jgi:hypothetical protein
MESPDRLVIDSSHRSPPSSHVRVGLKTSSAESGAILLYRTEPEKEVIPQEGKYFVFPRRRLKPAPTHFAAFISTATVPRSLSPVSSTVRDEASQNPSMTDPGVEQTDLRYHKPLSQLDHQTYRLTSSVSGHSMHIRRFCLADCLIHRASRSFLPRLMLQSPPPERQQHLQAFTKH